MTENTAGEDRNEVALTGRLPALPELRELPSGDTMVSFRLVVKRPAGDRGSIDSIDCVSTRRRVQRTLAASVEGDRLAVSGTLRRRFWRGATGVQSRYAVEATTVRRLKD